MLRTRLPPALSSLTAGTRGSLQELRDSFGQLYEADRHLPAKDQRSIKRLYEALVREGSPGLTIRYDDMPITNVLFRRLVTFPWSLMQATHCNLIGAMRRPILGELNARFMWRTSACVTAVNLLWWPTCAKAKRWFWTPSMRLLTFMAVCHAGLLLIIPRRW